jgi:hypothetical protein
VITLDVEIRLAVFGADDAEAEDQPQLLVDLADLGSDLEARQLETLWLGGAGARMPRSRSACPVPIRLGCKSPGDRAPFAGRR